MCVCEYLLIFYNLFDVFVKIFNFVVLFLKGIFLYDCVVIIFVVGFFKWENFGKYWYLFLNNKVFFLFKKVFKFLLIFLGLIK